MVDKSSALSSLFANSDSNNTAHDRARDIDCICIGSGRFLRAVLVPSLIGSGLRPIVVQTRGQSFQKYCRERILDKEQKFFEYEVDTVGYDGNVSTENIPCYGAGTLGTEQGKNALLETLEHMKFINVIGVGVTEAGLSSPKSKSLIDLADILYKCHMLMSKSRSTALDDNDESSDKRSKLGPSLNCSNPNERICVINTDNVPCNGSIIRDHLYVIANTYGQIENRSAFLDFLKTKVAFHNTMVDRITSQRESSNGLVPKAEPIPAKALVIEDLNKDLPLSLNCEKVKASYGVIVRTKPNELNRDIALKLRVANGTHTAVAQVMALSSLLLTDVLSPQSLDHTEEGSLLRKYLDEFFESQILSGAENTYGEKETKAVYEDWRRRLCHAHFGLSSFFITQNAAAKGGIRFGPTIYSLVQSGKDINATTIFALATILRFLTPVEKMKKSSSDNEIYRGWLDGFNREIGDETKSSQSGETVTYADGLRYNLSEGWYEFRCSCKINVGEISNTMISLPDALVLCGKGKEQPCVYEDVIRAYLMKNDGCNLDCLGRNIETSDLFENLIRSTATLYARMVAGDGMLTLLREMTEKEGIYNLGLATSYSRLVDGPSNRCYLAPLHYRESPIPKDSNLLVDANLENENTIMNIVYSEVSSVEVIDLHTHLMPPSHGALCLWGIDELLTYHYLVSEYFITAPSNISPEYFYKQNKQHQANLIWKSLFVDRSPISEACRGVITVLHKLGLDDELKSKDLNKIRKFFDSYRNEGLAGVEKYCEMVYKIAGVKYTVMTNIPFDANEAKYWRPKRKEYSNRFKSALRVDPLLAGDRKTIERTLAISGYKNTLEDTRQYLRDWCDTMKPEYMMASTPHNFVLDENKGTISGMKNSGVNEAAMKTPFAFVDVVGNNKDCNEICSSGEDATASVINEQSDFLGEVLMKVCEERDIPIALKIGAHRGVNPSLQQAGDGVVGFADVGVLTRLCNRFPKVRFLGTFLSKNNQHEACVLASKFRNFHLYGCWWFCNNPSLIEEITKMRVEMLGTAFTAQHSDSRVIDQLIYKWSHSRCVIAGVLAKEYTKLLKSGHNISRQNIRCDVQKLFGESYEDFMAKSFA